MTAFLTSLAFVVLAEMGDKTQLLAMALATRYRTSVVMWGVLAATAVNHLLAVVLGSSITRFIPMFHIQIAAAVSFILFGLWTLHGDELHGEDRRFSFSPFWTVTIAFFVAEMGDKTQLATVALAAKFHTVIPVWLGTTTGMMIADAIGIVAGIVMHKRIPEQLVKWLAALAFMLFGVLGLYDSLPKDLATFPAGAGTLLLIALLAFFIERGNRKRREALAKCSEEAGMQGASEGGSEA